MLQLVTPGAASAVSTPASEVLPAKSGIDQPVSAQGAGGIVELFASELGSVAQQEAALLATLTPAVEVAVEPQNLADDTSPAAPELEAEQWLLSMLGQHEVQLQARDMPSPAHGPDVVMRASANVQYAPLTQSARVSAAASRSHFSDVRVPVTDNTLDVPSNQAAVADSTRLTALLTKAEAPLPAQVKPADTPLLAALESLAGTAGNTPTEAAEGLATASSTALQSSPSAALERSVRLQGPEAKWGEQMLSALRDNVELQVQQRVQSTTIRLDPPELGSMEIFLSHESGRLSVQITASQADVARLLQSTSERLRQELVGQHFTQVSVGVSSDSQSSQQHAQQGRTRLPSEADVATNQAGESGAEATTRVDRDVLITV